MQRNDNPKYDANYITVYFLRDSIKHDFVYIEGRCYKVGERRQNALCLDPKSVALIQSPVNNCT